MDHVAVAPWSALAARRRGSRAQREPQGRWRLQVLAKIWRVDIPRARSMIQRLSDAGIVRHATLANGSVWCVPTTSFSSALKHEFEEDIPAMHAAVLAVYEDRPSFTSWANVKDDGFIALNLISHLAANGRIEEMRCAPPPPAVHAVCIDVRFWIRP